MRSNIHAAGSCALVLLLAAGAWAHVSSGESAVGMLETQPPDAGALVMPANGSDVPLSIEFFGAYDSFNELTSVELFFRTDSTEWMSSGLVIAGEAGTFEFYPPTTGTTYFFQLVALDSVGNFSVVPVGSSGSGQASILVEPQTSVQDWWVLR